MITLMEYLTSVNSLFQVATTSPLVVKEYRVTKYCKIPVLDSENVEYVSVRPNDVVQVVESTLASESKIAYIRFVCGHDMSLMETRFKPKWSCDKIRNWITTNTEELKDDSAETSSR